MKVNFPEGTHLSYTPDSLKLARGTLAMSRYRLGRCSTKDYILTIQAAIHSTFAMFDAPDAAISAHNPWDIPSHFIRPTMVLWWGVNG